jgi:hypothetical protein
METKQLQLVAFKQSERLKKLGFDWEVTAYYNEDGELFQQTTFEDYNSDKYYDGKAFTIDLISAPAVALVLKWLRDKGEISYVAFDWQLKKFYYVLKRRCLDFACVSDSVYETYEEAESAMLDEMLNVLEEEKD